MIDRGHELSVSRQAQLLELPRSTVYYLPKPTSADDLALMRRIDELHLEHPFAGARMLRDLLLQEGHWVGRKHVGTLMTRMGIEALYRRPSTSRKHLAHRIYPYLLRDRVIERPNEVWAMDITYIPMHHGRVIAETGVVQALLFTMKMTRNSLCATAFQQILSARPATELDQSCPD